MVAEMVVYPMYTELDAHLLSQFPPFVLLRVTSPRRFTITLRMEDGTQFPFPVLASPTGGYEQILVARAGVLFTLMQDNAQVVIDGSEVLTAQQPGRDNHGGEV